MITNFAFLLSTNVVTCLRPYFNTAGAAVAELSLPEALAALPSRRFALASSVSGAYLVNNLNSSAAWFLSRVLLNWLIAGGTLRR